jgi:cell division protein FtsI (penicillin-binding protein 3)
VVHDADGTGKRARLDGWRAAGKTGTAQKADPVTRRYSADKRFSSFVGYAPADQPRIVVGVFIDEPRGEVYGGEIAAPVFREVTEHALKLLGIPPSAAPAVAGSAAPANVAARAESGQAARPEPGHPDRPEAERGAAARALTSVAEPRPDDEVSPAPSFEEEPATAEDGTGVAVPALAGLPARAALRALEAVDLVGEVKGSGRVTAQSPRPGEVVERGSRVRLVLAPPRP